MTVMVPTENAALAGLRRVIDEETVEKVLNVLRDDVSDMPKNWNRRFKHNRDKIKTGDIYELAEVVRNLALRENEKGLSSGEKQMYTRAKKILASELMYALDKDEDEAEAVSRRAARRARPTARRRRRGADAGAGRWRSRWSWPPDAGSVLGQARPKALVELAGRPMLQWSVDGAARRRRGRARSWSRCRRACGTRPRGLRRRRRRRASARPSVAPPALAAPARGDPVLVHDARTPAVTPELIEAVLAAALDGVDCAIAAAPVTDTVKEATARAIVVRDARPRAAVGGADAAGLHAAPRSSARSRARGGASRAATDEAWLVERGGRPGAGRAAPRENLKVTTPLDLHVAEQLLAARVD